MRLTSLRSDLDCDFRFSSEDEEESEEYDEEEMGGDGRWRGDLNEDDGKTFGSCNRSIMCYEVRL